MKARYDRPLSAQALKLELMIQDRWTPRSTNRKQCKLIKDICALNNVHIVEFFVIYNGDSGSGTCGFDQGLRKIEGMRNGRSRRGQRRQQRSIRVHLALSRRVSVVALCLFKCVGRSRH